MNRRSILAVLSTIPGLSLIAKPAKAQVAGQIAKHREGLTRMLGLALDQCEKAEGDSPMAGKVLKKVEFRVTATFEDGTQIANAPVYEVLNPSFETKAKVVQWTLK